ncbi:3-oxoacyl-[acyl-carrier-protein] synthase-3 [Syntrophus gentianae]|uniref:3-oxoacyl-[acyl-carrier-protein] synthase-3 n=1 Tax=Syntrophus gentianae TaxID=43775 RepID=A0A1H7ZVQ0_9BACT|nr:ketoacyl-ACP synthase III [Syntrophus gentianae]SEM61658.1 3-oxoacyl-[acyl-carrier-protein] synthase-3 [Syntrophus gentianae]
MLYLHGLGHFHPENVISNSFLEELDIGTNEEWIMDRVGIMTRRTVLSLDYIRSTKNSDPRAALEASEYNNAQIGAFSAQMALERAGLSTADIGMVISGSSASDHLTPVEASTIAAELNIDVPCLDVNSACSSFGMDVHVLSMMKPEALPPFVLIVNPETMTKSVDYSDRSIAVLFGDGSAAAVVSSREPSRSVFLSSFCDSKPTAWEKVVIPRMGYFRQDGHAVQGFAIRKTTDSIRTLQSVYPVNRFVGHQANLGMLRTACERTGIVEDQHWHNVEHFGNTGCSGAPAVLSQHWQDLTPGDHVAVCVVGGGLTWVHTLLKIEDSL